MSDEPSEELRQIFKEIAEETLRFERQILAGSKLVIHCPACDHGFQLSDAEAP